MKSLLKNQVQTVASGSGNVFCDLGLEAESDELAVKAELTRQVYHRIRSLNLTQAGAAERLGISQPDVSKLMNGRHTRFSVERLITLLNALSVDVEIIVRPPRSRTVRPGRLTIRERAAA